MTFVMDITEDFLKMMGWAYLRLDGGTKTEERASFVQMFNAGDSEYKVSNVETRRPGVKRVAASMLRHTQNWLSMTAVISGGLSKTKVSVCFNCFLFF
jgi:hypothetical protein